MNHLRAGSPLLFLALVVPSSSYAQTGFALRGGSLGPGVEVAHQLKSFLSVRAGGTYFKLSDLDFTIEDETIDIGLTLDTKLNSVYLLADLMPIGGFIHFTGGVVYNAIQIDGTGKALTDYQLESRTFTKAQVGSLSASLSYESKIAPYAGIGFGNVANGRTIGLTLDAGVIFSGPITVTLDGTGMLEPTAEQAPTIQEALDGVRIFPVLSLGLVIRP